MADPIADDRGRNCGGRVTCLGKRCALLSAISTSVGRYLLRFCGGPNVGAESLSLVRSQTCLLRERPRLPESFTTT